MGVGQLLQHQDFQRRIWRASKQLVWGVGGFSIYQSSYYFAKIKDFNDLVFFFYKNEEIERKI